MDRAWLRIQRAVARTKALLVNLAEEFRGTDEPKRVPSRPTALRAGDRPVPGPVTRRFDLSVVW